MRFALRMAGAAAGAMMNDYESHRARALSAAVAWRRRTRRLPGTERAPTVDLPREWFGSTAVAGWCGWRLAGRRSGMRTRW